MAEVVVESLLQNLQMLQTHHINLIKGAESHIEKLERDLLLLMAFLKDSIRKQDPNLEDLLFEIREVVYDAEYVIDDLVTQANLSKSKDFYDAFETPELARIADVVESVGCKVKDIYDPEALEIYDPEALENSEAEVEFVLQKLQRILTNDKLLIKSSESHVEKLEKDLHLFEAFINDSTKKLREDKELKDLLRQMHDLVYDAEDVIDAFMTQTEVNVHGITKVVDSVRDIYGMIDMASPSAGERDSSEESEVDVENYAATRVVKGLSKEISENPVLLTPHYEKNWLNKDSRFEMAASAYAAVVSLIHVLDNIQHPARHRLHFDRKQIETLREKVSFLCDFIGDYSQRFYTENKDLARQISDVADEAEQVIDCHVVNQLSQRYADKADMGLSSFSEDIGKIIDKIESIQKELMMVKEETAVREQPPRSSLPAGSSGPHSSDNKLTMVGFEENLIEILDQLTGGGSHLQVLPIVGMGGIGKTVLAQKVFENPFIVEHFDIRSWSTISQEYSAQQVLLSLLRTTSGERGGLKNKQSSENLDELGKQLYVLLYGKRYLIIMDDVWSREVLDDLRRFLPDNHNGSRIIVTTRLSNVAVYLGSSKPYLLNFLDEGSSWNLLCEKAFGGQRCPLELVEIGKKIAKGCHGLPLAIDVIGGLLSSNMKQEYWEFVAENVTSFADLGYDGYCLKILSLSYNHLPIHLKPCFLSMRVFPENCEIRASHIIKLWVAEGFIRGDKSLKEVAEKYLKDLIDRNLLLIRQLRYDGRIKTCSINGLLKDLCLRASEEEHLFKVPKVQHAHITNYKTACFLCSSDRNVSTEVRLPQVLVTSKNASRANCSVCDECRIMYPQLATLRLVRVIGTADGQSCENFLQPTRLRYLYLSGKNESLLTSILLLWNLHTLIIDSFNNLIVLPSEIWEMPQLGHLEICRAVLPDPPLMENSYILENLQTLSTVVNFRCSDDVLERIPNVKKLRICYSDEFKKNMELSYYTLKNLAFLLHLESLFLSWEHFTLTEIAFPLSLKKLSLENCEIPWRDMTIIGSLPNLEALKLYNNAFRGLEWYPVEGEFRRLKLLLIQNNDLMHYGVDCYSFPVLEILVLEDMLDLTEIPSEIGDIPTLRSIHLSCCGERIISSAERIIEEQREMGNDDLQLHISKISTKRRNMKGFGNREQKGNFAAWEEAFV